jgi:YD repeat-containing protein
MARPEQQGLEASQRRDPTSGAGSEGLERTSNVVQRRGQVQAHRRICKLPYDAYGQLTLADKVGGTAEDRAYSYDAAGNMTRNSGLCTGATSPLPLIPPHFRNPSTRSENFLE